MSTETPAPIPAPARSARVRRRTLVWTIAAIVVAACAAALPFIEIRGVAAIPVAQALVPVGALVLLLSAVVSAAFRLWVAAGALVLGALVSGVPTLTPLHAGPDCVSDSPVTVMSFNAKLSGADPDALAERVRDTDATVVVLLETDEELIETLLTDEGLAEQLPHRTGEVTAGPASGSVILSAYPLSREEEVPGSEFDQVGVVADVPGVGDVRLAAVHPPPPVWQPNGWLDGIDAIAAWVRQAPDDRLIVAGDFNASFAHPALRRMAAGLRSGAEAAGPIPGPTWPEGKAVPAFTAIDHVFARGAMPTSWESFAVDGSDHRAVVARWALCPSA